MKHRFTFSVLLALLFCLPQVINAKQSPTIEFTQSYLEVYLGYTLDASQFLNNPANLPVTWASSDKSVFTIDQNGVITGIAPNMSSAWIEVDFEGNDDYYNLLQPAKVSVFVLNQYPLSIGDFKLTPDMASSFWGDRMSFNPVTSTLTMTECELSRRDIVWDHPTTPLTIRLVGANVIEGGGLGVSNLILTGGGSLKQDAILYAQSVVIDSASLRIETAFQTSSDMKYSFNIDKLAIKNKGHFYAIIKAEEGNILGEYDHVGFVNKELNLGAKIDFITSYLPPQWLPDVLKVEGVSSTWKKEMFNGAFFWKFEHGSSVSYLLLRGELEIGYTGTAIHELPDFEPTHLSFDNMDANQGKMAVILGENDEITDGIGANSNVFLATPVTIPDTEIDDLLKNYSPLDVQYMNSLPGITIKLPEGKGDIKLNVSVNAGWSVTFKQAGKTLFNWDTEATSTFTGITYDNPEAALACLYVQKKGGSPAPVRKLAEEVVTGVCVYSIEVIPQQSITAIEKNEDRQSSNCKFFKDGQLLIYRNGRIYTVSGAEVK